MLDSSFRVIYQLKIVLQVATATAVDETLPLDGSLISNLAQVIAIMCKNRKNMADF